METIIRKVFTVEVEKNSEGDTYARGYEFSVLYDGTYFAVSHTLATPVVEENRFYTLDSAFRFLISDMAHVNASACRALTHDSAVRHILAADVTFSDIVAAHCLDWLRGSTTPIHSYAKAR